MEYDHKHVCSYIIVHVEPQLGQGWMCPRLVLIGWIGQGWMCPRLALIGWIGQGWMRPSSNLIKYQISTLMLKKVY